MSTVHVVVAGVASALPAASTARTSSVWEPSCSGPITFGAVHVAQAPPSSRHCNVPTPEPASLPVKPIVAVGVPTRAAGCTPSVVSGAIVSTSQEVVAGVASVLPATSVARTVNVCEPCARPLGAAGLVHAAQAPVSSLHWNDAIPEPASLPANAIDALAEPLIAAGPEPIVVSGAIESTLQVVVAGVGSLRPP